jgi:hypothetical protein
MEISGRTLRKRLILDLYSSAVCPRFNIVAQIDGIDRIRYTTSHPVEFSDSLIQAYAEVPELVSRVNKTKRFIENNLINKCHCVRKILLIFTWETNNNSCNNPSLQEVSSPL